MADNTLTLGLEVMGAREIQAALDSIQRRVGDIEKDERAAYAEDQKRTEKKIADLRKLQAAQEKSAQAARAAASAMDLGGNAAEGGLKKVTESVKRLAGNLSALGGGAGAEFAKLAGGALGLGEAIAGVASGPMLVLTGAVYAITEAYKHYAEQEKNLEDMRKGFDEANLQRKSLIFGVQNQIFALIDKSSLAEAEAAKKSADANVAILTIQSKSSAAMLEAMRKNGDASSDYFKSLAKDHAATVEQLAVAVRQRDFAESALLTEQMKSEAKRRQEIAAEAKRELARQSQEDADRIMAQEKQDAADRERDRQARNADFARRLAEEEKARNDSWAKSNAAFKSFEGEVSAINAEAIKLRSEKHGEWVDAYIDMLNMALREEDKINKEAAQSRAKAFKDAHLEEEKKALEATTKASKDAAAAAKKHTEEIQRQNKAIREHTLNVYTNSAAQVAHDAVTWAVMPGIDLLTEKTDALSKANRDNFWELYDFTKMTPELVAARVQAILAGIAKEATVKSIFEYGEAVKEGAAGLGSLAIYDAQGASMHFASASAHVAAAGAYGMIGGVAATGAIGIAATRGATAEEKEKRNQGSSAGGASMSSGSTMGGGNGGRDSGFSVTVINNAPLIVPPADQNRAGRAVARAVSRANRDAFARREMGQR